MSDINSYFSDLFITKDTLGNADFLFATDIDKFLIDNSAHTVSLQKMSNFARSQYILYSRIVSFNIRRQQVKKTNALSKIGSAIKDNVFSDETKSITIVDSYNAMSEVPLELPSQNLSETAANLRFLTASDTNLSKQTAGVYRYELSLEAIDGFVPMIQQIISKLSIQYKTLNRYYELVNQSNNYDSKRGRVKVQLSERNVKKIAEAYVQGLAHLNELADLSLEYQKSMSLIVPTIATIESIGLFKNRMETVIDQLSSFIKKQHSAGGLEDTSANSKVNKKSTLSRASKINLNHVFKQTVSIEQTKNYVNRFPSGGKVGGGLNRYGVNTVNNSASRIVTFEPPKSSLQLMADVGVTLTILPSTDTISSDCPEKKKTDIQKYLGDAPGVTQNLLRSTLSPIDLSTSSPESVICGEDIENIFSNISSKINTISTLTRPIDNSLIAQKDAPLQCDIAPIGGTTALPTTLSNEIQILTAFNVSDNSALANNCQPPSETLLKSLNWKSLSSVDLGSIGGNVLGRVTPGSVEVINEYFLVSDAVSLSNQEGNPIVQANLTTDGTEYKLPNGSNYAGSYHIHRDGTVMTGATMGDNEQVLTPINTEPVVSRVDQSAPTNIVYGGGGGGY
tara:strand:+ start:1166 stop:3031 length:1866 start_codon:yes stop_codon:yes gene_type:complete